MDQDAVVNSLKTKTIDEFNRWFNRVQNGYKEDYKVIMDLICLITYYSSITDNHYIARKLLQ